MLVSTGPPGVDTVSSTDSKALEPVGGLTAVHWVVLEQLTSVAGYGPKLTRVAPGVGSSPRPVIVTVVPAGPEAERPAAVMASGAS